MKRFRFHLEKVLTVRELQSREAEQALSAARAEVRKAEEYLAHVQEVLCAYSAELEERRSRGMSAADWVQTSYQLEAFHHAERDAERLLLEAKALAEARRMEWEHARQSEESLERLKERKREIYQHEYLSAEQAVNDEIAQNMRRVRGMMV